MQRGKCAFAEKVRRVQEAGGIAVVVGDNTPSSGLLTMYAKGTLLYPLRNYSLISNPCHDHYPFFRWLVSWYICYFSSPVSSSLVCSVWVETHFYRRHIRHPHPFNFHPAHLLSLPLLPPNRHPHPRHNNPPLHRLRLAPPRHSPPRSPVPSVYPGMYLYPPPSATTSPATQGIGSPGGGAEFAYSEVDSGENDGNYNEFKCESEGGEWAG